MATPSAKDMLMQVPRYADGGPVQSEGLSRALNQHGQTQEQFDQNIRAYAAKNTNPLDALNAMTQTGISMEDVTRAMGAEAVKNYFTIDPNQGEKAPGPVTSGYTSDLQDTWLASTTHGGQEGLNARIKDLATMYAGNPDKLRDLFVSSGASTLDLERAKVDPSVLYATVPSTTAKPPTPRPTPTPLPTLPVIPPYTPPVVTPQTQIQYPQPTPYTATSVYQPIAAPPPIYGAGQPALDVNFRNSAPRSEYGSYGYTYTPAASLLPATGAGMSWTPPSVTSRPRSLLPVPLPTAAKPQYSASQQFARDRAAAQLAALPVGGGGRFSGMQAPVAPPLDPNAPVDPYGVKATEFRNFAPPPLTGVAKGGEIKKSEGTADPSARAMLDNLDSEAPVKRNLPKEAQDARRARIGQAPAVPQDYSGRDLTGELLNVASLATAPVPFLGDAAGLAADARMYQMHPEERTMGNYLLSGLGIIPFVPSVSAVKTAGKGVKTAAEELAALGTYYHGTDKNILDSAGNLNFKTGQRGAVFLTPDPSFADKYALNDTQLLPNDIDRMVTQGTPANEGASIYPVTPNVLNTFDINNKDHLAKLKSVVTVGGAQKARWKPIQEFIGQKIREENPWVAVERLLPDIKTAGFDSAFIEEMGRRNLAVFDPKNVESALAGKGVKTAAADLLDLSQGAKAARQVEQGYAPQDFYHATYKGFDAFDPDMVGLGTHIGTAEQANNRLKFFSKNLTGPGAEIGSNIIPLKARLGKTLEMSDVGQWNDSFDVLRSFRRNMEETNLEDYSESISDGVRDFSHPITFDKKQLQRVDDLLAESDEMQDEYRDAITTPIKFKSFLLDESDQMQVEYSDDITAWIKSPENKELLDKTKKLIQGMGYDSIRYINRVENAPDNSDFSYIVLDPKNLRAKTADYDPSKLESSDLGHAKGGPVQKYATGNEVSSTTADLLAQMKAIGDMPNTPTPDPDPVKTESQNMLQRFTSLNTPKDMSLGEILADIAMGFAPAIGTAQGARDFERARRDNDTLGMVLGAASMIPVGGGTVKAVKGIAKGVKTAAEELPRIVLNQSKENSSAKTALAQIKEQFQRNPFDDREIVGDGAAATLYTTGDDSLHLSDIRTLDPGKGNSSRLLSQILAITDKNKVDVDLIAEAYNNKGLSTEQLRDWYARNGFEALEQDPDTMLRMYDRAATRGPLDKTLEARMARAAEQGYTGPLYHGTADIENEGFDEFNKKFYGSVTNSPSAKMGTWLTDDPKTANIYASFAPFSTLQGLQDKYANTVEKLWRKSSMLEGEARTAAREKDKLKLAPLADKIKQVTEALEAGVPDPAEARKFFPLPTRIGGGGGANIMPVRARGNFMEYDAGDTSIRELRDKKGLTKLGKEAKEAGYDGLKITNFRDPMTAPSATHYLVFDTKNIRSEYADYDPSKLESSNLGHADGGLIQKYATGNEVSSNTKDLIAQMNAIGARPNTPTPNAPTPNAPLAKEQTDSASMLDNLIRAYEQNISKPAVGSVIDMTLGLGDLGQMGAKYLANRAGIKTDPFVSTAEPAKAAAGVTGYDPYTIGGIATNLLPFARGKQAIGGAAKTFASMFPNLGREALSYAGGEAGAAAAREALPDSTLAQVVAGGAGSIAAGRGGSSTMSNMAVKNEGGNWIKGSIKEGLKSLKQYQIEGGQRLFQISQLPPSRHYTSRPDPLNAFVDKQLTDYVQNKMGTPTDTLRIIADKYAEERPALLAAAQAKIDALYAKGDRIARERGVPRESLTQHRQDEIAAEKAKALIEARQPLHRDNIGISASINNLEREAAGLPVKGYGVSEAARRYENMADAAINNRPARDWQRQAAASDWQIAFNASNGREYDPSVGLFRRVVNEVKENPWLKKVSPETPVYEMQYDATHLGFDHLIDELRNAINPNSGLPKELLINPKDLPKITMEQAVNRVADINAWRSVNRAEANFALANNPATFIHKQYPDGMKWVQIKRPENLPEGWTVDKVGKTISPEGKYAEDPRQTAVSDALKYEGDTMVNCVGGYCNRVLEGKSEIFSLRNVEGLPFATIEVRKGKPLNDPTRALGQYNLNIDPKLMQEYTEAFVRSGKHNMHFANDFWQWLKQTQPETYEAITKVGNPRIEQIKGVENAAVDKKYWPLVQDFINSGTWGEVRESSNAGLTKEANGKYVLKSDRQAENLAGGGAVRGYEQGGPITKKAKGGNVERVYNDRKYI